MKITGLESLLAKEHTFGSQVQGTLTDHLLNVGQTVADDTEARYLDYSVEGAYGVRARVFTSGLWVVQTLRRARSPLRQRPNFGPLMMRKAFLPAARANEPRILLAAELAVEEAKARYWNT